LAIFSLPLDFFYDIIYNVCDLIQSLGICYLSSYIVLSALQPNKLNLLIKNMGLPSKKRTPRSKHDRASHFALKQTNTIKCENCGTKILPHKACPKCGTYKGKKVINTEKRTLRLKRSKKGTGKTK